MAPLVEREGVLKTHIVFDANAFNRFLNIDDEYWQWYHYQLAHECGHAHDRRAFDLAILGLLLTPYNFGDELAKTRFELGDGCWSEYAASRLSAEYLPGQVDPYEQLFMNTLEGLDKRTSAVISKFASDNDRVGCFKSLAMEYERILKYASYLLGHLNGLGRELDLAPKFKEFLESKHWLAEYVIELDDTLDEIWAKYGEWTGFEDFTGLGSLILLLVARHRLHATLNGDRMLITIH
jgi:hypothetical protein